MKEKEEKKTEKKKNPFSGKHSIRFVAMWATEKNVFSWTNWKEILQAETATAAKSIYFNVADTLSQYTHARTHACKHACTHMHAHIHTRSCMHTHTHTHANTHVCLHTHVRLHTHTRLHALTYTHTRKCNHNATWKSLNHVMNRPHMH